MKALLISLLILIPCFWHTHIQAGDVPSHTYNVWLVQMIQDGRAPGLFVYPIFSNVLYDLWSGQLISWTGFQWGERLAVSTVVLTFFWGAWTWIQVATRINPWSVAPLLAMFTYGYVFHMGFMNFYWSVGICFGGLACSESESHVLRRLWWLALIPAGVAHMLPVGWAAGIWAYGQLMKQTPLKWRKWLLLSGLASIVALNWFIRWRYNSLWAPDQILGMLGIDQLWLTHPHHLIFATGFLAIWALALLWTLDRTQVEELHQRTDFHYLALTALGVFLIPHAIHFPSFSGPLSFITQRMSLMVAVLMTGWILLCQRPRQIFWSSLPLAAVYFVFLYMDTKPLDEFEKKLHTAVRTMPAGVRVVAPFIRKHTRFFSYGHLVDRACIGHCFSYANYEAATTQFRVRAYGPNPFVAHDNAMSIALQDAAYKVKAEDAPLYYFKWNPEEKRFVLRVLNEGDEF